jgi:hypothetical protein
MAAILQTNDRKQSGSSMRRRGNCPVSGGCLVPFARSGPFTLGRGDVVTDRYALPTEPRSRISLFGGGRQRRGVVVCGGKTRRSGPCRLVSLVGRRMQYDIEGGMPGEILSRAEVVVTRRDDHDQIEARYDIKPLTAPADASDPTDVAVSRRQLPPPPSPFPSFFSTA